MSRDRPIRSILLGIAVTGATLAGPVAGARAGTFALYSADCVTPRSRRLPIGVWTMRDDGTGLGPLPGSAGDTGRAPSFSPDGRRIAYIHAHVDTSPLPAPDTVWTMDANGSDPRDLSPPIPENPSPEQMLIRAQSSEQPTWTADGRRILFLSNYDPSGQLGWRHVWSMRADGSDRTQLTFGSYDDMDLHWIEGRTRIAFRRSYGSSGPSDPRSGDYSMLPDGSDLRRLSLGDVGVGGAVTSPDGRYVASWENGPQHTALLHIIDQQTGEVRLADIAAAYFAAIWVPGATPTLWLQRAPDAHAPCSNLAHITPSGPLVEPPALACRLLFLSDWSAAPAAGAARAGIARRAPDRAPPVVELTSARHGLGPSTVSPSAAATIPALTASRAKLRLVAYDESGIRSLRLAIAPARGSAKRARSRVLATPAAFRSRLRGLRPGSRYLLSFTATDAAGNTTRAPRRVLLRLTR